MATTVTSPSGVTFNPALKSFAINNQGNLSALANFIVDNQTNAVYKILTDNGLKYNSKADAAVIVQRLLTSTNATDKSTLLQLQKIPYFNDNTNGTGGVKNAVGAIVTEGIGDDLICLGGGLFGLAVPGCSSTGTPTNSADAAKLQAAQDAANAAKAQSTQTSTYLIAGGAVLLILLLLLYFYFSSQNKEEDAKIAALAAAK